MKANVKFSVGFFETMIDLEDYGFDENIRFEQLSEKEQHEIEDSLRDTNFILVSVSSAD